MGVEHALKTIAHRVGSYQYNTIRMVDTNVDHSKFIGRDQ
jgi:hypothetical protein